MAEKETEMEILDKFLGVEIKSQKKEIHSSFLQLVDMSRNEVNRRDVDDQIFFLVADLMHKVFTELDNSDVIKWDILFEMFRYLMSLMSESRTNQDRVRNNGHFISFIHENFYSKARIGWNHEKYPKRHFFKILRVGLQATGNYMIQNKANIKDYLSVDEGLKSLLDLLDYSDDGIKIYALINLHCILKTRPISGNACLDKSSIEAILDNMKLDEHYSKVLWLVFNDFNGSKKLTEVLYGGSKKTKISFFQALNRIEFGEMSSISDYAVEYILIQFIEYANDSMIKPELDCNGEALVETIKLLISVTSQELKDTKIIYRKNDRLVFTSTKLLKHIHDDTKPKSAKDKLIIKKIRVLLLKLIKNFNFEMPVVLRTVNPNSLIVTLLETYTREAVNGNENKDQTRELCNLAMDVLKIMNKSQQAHISIRDVIKSRPDFSDINEITVLLK